MSAWRIPLFDTRFGPEEEAAVLRPLRAGWLTMGEEVVELEKEVASLGKEKAGGIDGRSWGFVDGGGYSHGLALPGDTGE